jgi:hypothetical protein
MVDNFLRYSRIKYEISGLGLKGITRLIIVIYISRHDSNPAHDIKLTIFDTSYEPIINLTQN